MVDPKNPIILHIVFFWGGGVLQKFGFWALRCFHFFFYNKVSRIRDLIALIFSVWQRDVGLSRFHFYYFRYYRFEPNSLKLRYDENSLHYRQRAVCGLVLFGPRVRSFNKQIC